MSGQEDIQNVIHELAIVVSNIEDAGDEKRLLNAINILEKQFEKESSQSAIEYYQPEV